VRSIGAGDLQAGAGTDFASPLDVDVLVATLAIRNTGGGAWSVKVAREGNENDWPPGVTLAVKRSGGVDEAGITDGTSYRALSGDLQTFFNGAGDYHTIQILLRLEGLTVQTAPGAYNLTIRYAIESAG
jgi:hypothetical protein